MHFRLLWPHYNILTTFKNRENANQFPKTEKILLKTKEIFKQCLLNLPLKKFVNFTRFFPSYCSRETKSLLQFDFSLKAKI